MGDKDLKVFMLCQNQKIDGLTFSGEKAVVRNVEWKDDWYTAATNTHKADIFFSITYNKVEYDDNVVLLTENSESIILFAGYKKYVENGCKKNEFYIWGYMSKKDKQRVDEQLVERTFRTTYYGRSNYNGTWQNRKVQFLINKEAIGEENWTFFTCEYTYATLPLKWLNEKSVKGFDALLELVAPDEQYNLLPIEYEYNKIRTNVEEVLINNLIDFYAFKGNDVNYFAEFVHKVKSIKNDIHLNSRKYIETVLVDIYDRIINAEDLFRFKKGTDNDFVKGLVGSYCTIIENLLKALLIRPITDNEIKKEINLLHNLNDFKDQNNKKSVFSDDDLVDQVKKYIEKIEYNDDKFNLFKYIKLISDTTISLSDKFKSFTLGNFSFCYYEKYVGQSIDYISDKNYKQAVGNIYPYKNMQAMMIYEQCVINIISRRLGDVGQVKTSERIAKLAKHYRNPDGHGDTNIGLEDLEDTRNLIYGNGIVFEDLLLDNQQQRDMNKHALKLESSILWQILANNWEEVIKLI